MNVSLCEIIRRMNSYEKNKTLFILLLLLVTVNFGKYTFIVSTSPVAPTSLHGETENDDI